VSRPDQLGRAGAVLSRPRREISIALTQAAWYVSDMRKLSKDADLTGVEQDLLDRLFEALVAFEEHFNAGRARST
jgi:hypothetical protein